MHYLNSQYTAMSLPYLAWISIQSHMLYLSVPMYWNTLSLNSLLWSSMTKPASGSSALGAGFVNPPRTRAPAVPLGPWAGAAVHRSQGAPDSS